MKKLLVTILCTFAVFGCFAFTGCSESGEILSLEQAYKSGYLTQEDLKSIAYHYHGGTTYNEEIMGENYKPIPKNPENLSEKTITRIKKIQQAECKKNGVKCSQDEIKILGYYGCYGKCVAIKNSFPGALFSEWIGGREIKVGDVNYHIESGNFFITIYYLK